jgi:hypothetical protein
LGGTGSGNWYRFDKKTTTGECHSVDVRYLHRKGLLKAGGWFSLRWSRGEHETGSIGGSVEGHLRSRPERVILRYRYRSGQGESGRTCGSPCPSPGLPVTSAERGRGSSVRARGAVVGLRSCMGRDGTSCAATATIWSTKVSARTI